MITKELIKSEIEKVNYEYLELLYKFIQILEPPLTVDRKATTKAASKDQDFNWHAFIAQTYGCLADEPIERGDQGTYEIREAI
jgi:hypothetical protein